VLSVNECVNDDAQQPLVSDSGFVTASAARRVCCTVVDVPCLLAWREQRERERKREIERLETLESDVLKPHNMPRE
jgi:hypothetical protein